MAVLATVPQVAAQSSAPAALRAVRGAAYVAPDGKLVRDPVVLVIRGERIERIASEVPPGVPLDDFADAVLCPGLVDCWSTLGVPGVLAERQQAVQPDVRAADALNRYTVQIRAALASGVTAFALVPSDENLVGGAIAVIGASDTPVRARLLRPDGPLKLSIAADVFKVDREPTSRMGALGILRDLLREANGAASRPERPFSATPAAGSMAELTRPESWFAFARGRHTGVLTAPRAADVLAALDFIDEFKLKLVLVHDQDARDIAAETAGRIAGVIVGPYDFESSPRRIEAAARFARVNVPVAIAGGLPAGDADTLRTGAALAARAGLPPDAARAAITSVPAALLGVAERIGALEAGRQADILVCSGDPLDLRARVLAVYVAGTRVAARRAPAETGVGL